MDCWIALGEAHYLWLLLPLINTLSSLLLSSSFISLFVLGSPLPIYYCVPVLPFVVFSLIFCPLICSHAFMVCYVTEIVCWSANLETGCSTFSPSIFDPTCICPKKWCEYASVFVFIGPCLFSISCYSHCTRKKKNGAAVTGFLLRDNIKSRGLMKPSTNPADTMPFRYSRLKWESLSNKGLPRLEPWVIVSAKSPFNCRWELQKLV